MARLASIVVVLGLAAAAYYAQPEAVPAADPDQISPSGDFAVCPIVVSDDRTNTEVGIAGLTPGPVAVYYVSGGAHVATSGAINENGSGKFAAGDVIGVGLSPAVLEFRGQPVAATFTEDASSLITAGCPASLPPRWLLPGGSTRDREDLELVLSNPFSVEALVAVDAASEAGVDSPSSLQSVIVPARSTVTIDMTLELALRQNLSVIVETQRGLVIPALRQGSGSDVAAWEGLSAGNQWHLVVPEPGDGTPTLVMNTDSPVDVPYEVDLLSDGGETVLVSGNLPARGQVVIEIPLQGVGLRVVAEGEVGAVVTLHGDQVRATAGGSIDPASRWLLPVAGSGESAAHSVWVLNPTDHEIGLVARSLMPGGAAFSAIAAPSEVTELGVDGMGAVLLEADEPVVAAFTASRAGAVAYGGGVAVDE